jgi:hypothetical protein
MIVDRYLVQNEVAIHDDGPEDGKLHKKPGGAAADNRTGE